jgi:phosphatidylglycerophosphatase A
MNLFSKVIATSLGAGYSPFAPGTCGALVGLFFYWLCFHLDSLGIFDFSQIHLIAAIIVFSGLGILATNQLEPEWGHDPQKIVMDETVGQWITLLFVPFEVKYMLLALVLFRFFDILKPLGIKKLEALPGGYGVMGDDILAGIYACLVMHGIIFFLNII